MFTIADMLPLLPKPALRCLVDAVAHSTCEFDDAACICSNAELNTQATTCITANSTIPEALTARNLTNTVCGIESKQDHSYDKVIIPFLTLACLAVVLRLAARVVQGVKFWWDDACNMLALVCCVAFTVIIFTMKDMGMGHDIWAVPQENISPLIMHYYVNFIMYATSRLFIRLSIILFFIRIFNLTSARGVMLFTFGLVNCSSLAFILSLIFQCKPVNYFWLRWDGHHKGSCMDLDTFMRATAILAIVVDFWQLLVAVPFVLRLNLSLKKRLLIVVMFTVGIAVVIISIVRYPTIEHFTGSRNLTRDIIPVGYWSALELDVGVICACLPSLQVLFKSCGRNKRSGDSSGFVEMTPTSGGSNGGTGASGRRFPASHIRKTVEIRQRTPADSEENLSFDPEPVQRREAGLRNEGQGYVVSQVWAK